MRIRLTLLALLPSALLLAQTANVTTGCAPLPVQFTPPPGVTTFFWNFQDGGSSNLAAPTNIFTAPGTYDVEFRETVGGPVVGTVTITVYPKPEVGFTAVPESGCIPLNVQFVDTTQLAGDIQVLGYSWVFGDGSSGTGPTPTHLYNTVGSFTVSLALTTNYSTCNVTQVFLNRIRTGIPPVVNFTTVPSPAVACQPPLNVAFTNTTTGGSGNLTYQWNLGNGNTSNLVDPPAQVYNQFGTFTVTLTATDAVGCSATTTKLVTVGPPTADFVVADTVCLGQAVTIANTSTPGLYQWQFGPFASPVISAEPSPSVTFNAPGLQTITLTVTSVGNCTATATQQVFVEVADASFTVVPTYSCSDPTTLSLNALSPGAIQWAWDFGQGTAADTKSPQYVWTTPDPTGYTSAGLWIDTIRLVVTTPAGCTAESSQAVSFWRPNARFMPDLQHGCAPLTVTFADSSISNEPIVRWTWLFDDGTPPLTVTNDNPLPHVFSAPGEYNVRLVIENSAGCVDTSYAVLIEVGEPIPGDFTVDKNEICPGDTVQFTNLTNDPRVDAWHFSSESDRLWHCFQNENPSWSYTSETGPLSVSLTTEYNGCFFTVTKDSFVLVKGPIAQLHYKTTCENTLEFVFTNRSQDATSVTWDLGDGNSTDIDTSFAHLYAMPGNYTVILTAENPLTGCPPSSDTAIVCPTILKADFTLPDTICGGQPRMLDGSNSLGVNATCYKGYTWYFSFQRPIRTDESMTEVSIGPSGPQTISLEVEDVNGCKDTLDREIFIYNNMPDFAISDDTICVPSAVSFTDLSSADAGIVKWEWQFGDGITSTQPNAVHTFSTPPANGTFYEVTLRIEDAFGCPGFVTKQVHVYKPVSSISTLPFPPNLCAGDTIAFSATDFTAGGSNLSWQWNLGNGQTAAGQTATGTYPVAGQYTARVVFTEIATGCKDSTFTVVNVQAFPQASFDSNVDGQNIICYPQNMLLTSTSTANSPLSITWDLGNGIMASGNQASTVFPKGTFTVTLIATTPFGCRDTVERSFTVVGPEGTFELDKNIICVGDTITFTLKDTVSISSWEWNFGDGTTAGKVNPVKHRYTFRPPSNATVARLVLKGEDDACSITVELPVNFSPVRANFSVALPACAGSSVFFTNTSIQADQSSWNFGDGGTSNLLNPSHVFATQGNYPVTLIVTDLPLGCRDTITQVVPITGIPGLQLFGDTICRGDTAVIGVQAPQLTNANFVWTPANLVLPPQNDDIVRVVPTQTTTFTLKIVDASGCQDEATTTVFVPTGFTGGENLDTIVAKGDLVPLPITFNPNYIFEWKPQDPGSPPVVRADSSVTYVVSVTDVWGCVADSFVFNILVVPEKVFAPNAFTPDGDGNNDVFTLLADGDEELVKVLTLRVYSRWGEQVYEGTGPLNTTGWNGQHNGKPAPSDVYAWLAEVEFLTGRKVLLKGDVTLLR